MSYQVRIDGAWPSPITISRGWSRAHARPWNTNTSDGFLRLERGSQEFLAAATSRLGEYGSQSVYSPALYPSSTRVWTKVGYQEAHRLGVMERSLSRPIETPQTPLSHTEPDWDSLCAIDDAAFEGFWRMGPDGLKEALMATSHAAILSLEADSGIVGYVIVGAQWGVAYLQRLAVHPEHRGRRIGADLVRGAIQWARKTTSQVMVLNVRDQNMPAQRLYANEGFTATGTKLRILRHDL